MDATNVPLRLIECIESMKNDVKRKIGMRDHHRAMYAECGENFCEGDGRSHDRKRDMAQAQTAELSSMLAMVRSAKS
jgi:hypothetical protein